MIKKSVCSLEVCGFILPVMKTLIIMEDSKMNRCKTGRKRFNDFMSYLISLLNI